MTFISRRLLLTNDNDQDVEIKDADFFELNAPLIILGEPGSGKSELVKELHNKSGSKIYNASALAAFSTIDMVPPPAKTIIDGIDEITAYGNGATITNILSKLSDHDSPNFVLTCRVVDWQDAVNTAIIEERWKQKPLVGKILPLNDQEIIEFINANGEGINGEEFIQEAERRDVIDLLKNPQNLIMLLKAIRTEGWPATRLQLYENASIEIIKEHNKKHESLNKGKFATDSLIDTAGFIFSQLLFSGEMRILIDVTDDSNAPEIINLVSDNYNESIIRTTLSTKIFRISGDTVLEACHRTIAEFLAAKWLSNALGEHLSLSRLESLLYGNNYIVPTALRGLHAWLATLTPKISEQLIARDPYGFLRYGDPSVLDSSLSRKLLNALENVAEIDPYFRSEDWQASFGHGLARLELHDDIIRLIRNPETPYQLSHLIIESVKGDSFSDVIANDLQDILLDTSATPLERFATFDVLSECNTRPDWHILIKKLRELGDLSSLRIAISITENNIENTSGTTIAETLIETTEAMAKENSIHYAGLGSRLHSLMSNQQLDESIQILSEYSQDERRTDEWIFKFLVQRLRKEPLPSPSRLWSWLNKCNGHSYYRSNWDGFSNEYFSKNPKFRQSIQEEALKTASDPNTFRLIFWEIRKASRGLWLRENDYIFHLTNLLDERDKYIDWHLRWKEIVNSIMMHSDFTGSALNHAREQASQYKVLLKELTDLENLPVDDYEEKDKQRKYKYKLRQQKEMQSRHASYLAIKDQLETGERIDVLHEVAGAYLGRYNNISGDTPLDRITNLVGESLVDLALKGIKSAISRKDIPTAKEMIELRAKENKTSFFESILLTYCAILNNNKSLDELPFPTAVSALAACQWGCYFSNDAITPKIQEQLESIVFHDNDSKVSFIHDTIDPYLENNAEHISGLYRITTDEEFSDVAGDLAIQWIKKYEQLPGNILHELLIAAIQNGNKSDLQHLIRERISKDIWKKEEQRCAWYGAAFVVDFEHHNTQLSQFAEEGKERLWAIHTFVNTKNQSTLSETQNFFLIIKFGPLWPPIGRPTGGWSGSNNPWDASDFIFNQISNLATNLSDQASDLLNSLKDKSELIGYKDHIKHLIAQQSRSRAEENKVLLPINGVRNILLHREPANVDDLQALIIDELNGLQYRIRNSPTNEIALFWNNDQPHDENYCRDRITTLLTPYMDRYNVRLHTEGTMPGNKRCDLLNTHNMIDLPIEIKGQWHSEIWTAASEQLQNYTREYRAKGRGIYLVLWFGYLGANNSKNPHGWKGQRLPKTIEMLNKILSEKYEDISEKTKIFVLDLSKL